MRQHFAQYFRAHPDFRLVALGSHVNRPFLDLEPFGQRVSHLDAAQHGALIDLYHRANRHAFDEELGLPGWVLVDFYLIPAAIGLLMCPAVLLDTSLRERLDLRPDDEAIAAAYYAVPTLDSDTVMGCSLFSLLPRSGAGRVIKALTLRMLGAGFQRGLSQWSNPSLRVHTRMGPLRLEGRVPASHGKAHESFLYRIDLRDSAQWLAHLERAAGSPIADDAHWVAVADRRALDQLLDRSAAGECIEIVWPGLSDDGTRVRVRSEPAG